MNLEYQIKRKITSTIISLVLHAILLLVLLTFTYKIYQAIHDGQAGLLKSSAAKISFGAPRQKKQTATSASSQTALPIVVNPKITQEEISTQTEDDPEPYCGINNSLTSREKSSIFDPQVDREISITQNIKRTYIQKKVNETQNEKKKKLTAAALVNGYRRAYNDEKEELNTSAQMGDTQNANPQKYPSYLQDQLNEFHIAAYKEKIHKSLVVASRWFTKEVYMKDSFSKTFKLVLTINENNMSFHIPPDQLTGNKEIDDSVIAFINSAQLPPLPSRLRGVNFQIILTFHMDCPRGSHTVKFIPM